MTAGGRHIFSNVKSTIQIFFLKQTGAGGAGINSAVPGSGEAPSASTFYSRVRTESEAARSLPCSLPPAPGLTATAVDDAAADATPGGGAEAVRVEHSTILASCGAGLVGPAVFDARSLAAPSLWVTSCPGISRCARRRLRSRVGARSVSTRVSGLCTGMLLIGLCALMTLFACAEPRGSGWW